MENIYIKCIKIIHDPREVRIYRALSAFFRLIGVFACENLTGDEYGDEVDITFKIEKGSEEKDIPAEEQARDILDEKKECFDNEIYAVISQIWEIFQSYDLMRKSYAIAYFRNSGKKEIYEQMGKAIEAFKSALNQLQTLEENTEKESPGNVYLWMAQASCQRRINELTGILWDAVTAFYRKEEEELREEKDDKIRKAKEASIRKEKDKKLELLSHKYIKFEEINKNIKKVLKVDSRFYAAYAVRGFAEELSKAYETKSVVDLKLAANMIKDKSYSSYLWFRIGMYYNNKVKRIKYCEKAYQVDRHNFRAIYQLAKAKMETGDKAGAKELWEKLRDVLECKRDLPSLQPVECAYLYKSYRKIGFLYNSSKNYETGIENLKKAEQVYKNINNEQDEKGFYPWMFGRDSINESGKKSWEVYKEAAREKLQIHDLYVEIVDVSARASLVETHDEYFPYTLKKIICS